MKKIVSINLGNFGSTGHIMDGISVVAEAEGYAAYRAYPQSFSVLPEKDNDIVIMPTFWNRVNQKVAKLTGLNGCFAAAATANFLRKLDDIDPDVIHFHNLHNSYINLPMFFSYIKRHDIPVVWTLHDCWSFTGHCPHFVIVGCDKWKTGCGDCPQLSVYPQTLIDTTHLMWEKKRQWFCGVKNMTIVTPSVWLADLVKQSYLKDYPVKVIYNGIDLDIFRPADSDLREKWGAQDKFIVLAVAMGWEERKGLDVVIELAKRLGQSYQVVIVGTDDHIDSTLPDNVISIHRTHDQHELAQVYSASDVLINPTREDNFPTVNLEALACGTPVITFRTGGSPEAIDDTCGSVVDCGDVDSMEREIMRLRSERPYSKDACLKRAANFDQRAKFKEYVELYDELLAGTDEKSGEKLAI